MEWTSEILELIKEAGYKGIPIKDFPEHFLTCSVENVGGCEKLIRN